MSYRLVLRALLLVVLSLAIVACGSDDEDEGREQPATGSPAAAAATATPGAAVTAGETPVRGGTLTVGLASDIANLDPFKSNLFVDRLVQYNVYDSLVTVDDKLEIKPGLAESWDTSDPKTVVFKLRQGVKFHDGTAFNAEAVRWNIQRILDDKTSPRNSELNTIASIEVVDPTTIKFNLKEPFAPLFSLLVDRAGMMVSPAAAEKGGAEFTRNPVGGGTGPFKFVEWKKDERIVLERNPEYWRKDQTGGALPYLDRVVYRPIPNEETRLANLKTGEIDVSDGAPAKDVEAIKKDQNLIYRQLPAFARGGIWLNSNAEPFNNKALRQAVAYAADRAEIVTTVLFDISVVGTGPVAPPHLGYEQSFKGIQFDQAKAKEKLAEAGKSSGFSFQLFISSGSPQTQIYGELLKDQLSKVGIDVQLVQQEFTKVVTDTQAGNFEASLIGWSGRIDPDGDMFAHFTSNGSFNYGKYSNPEADKALLEGRTNFDAEKRKAAYRRANQIIGEDAPYIFVSNGVASQVSSNEVRNYFLMPDQMMRYTEVWKKQ
ncbi:MAG: ABC transporter substrate-binding protein [Dehalococcoidia bacterium]